MGTTADKLAYLAETKAQIKAAIIQKGVAVADSAPFREYPDLIGQIEIGGGGLVVTAIDYSGLENGTFTVTYDDGETVSYTVESADGKVTAISDGTNTVSVDWGT